MPLLEEVGEVADDSSLQDADGHKAEHRRRRASRVRKRKKMEGSFLAGGAAFRVLLEAAIVIGVGSWARSKAMDRKSNACEMTFSRPMYVQIPVPGYPGRAGEEEGEKSAVEAGNSHGYGYGYRLMRYMDRKLPAGDLADPFKPRGAPVLFVPGHAGSYKQARSLGSHAAEMKISGPRRRLDIFALDLLEEWTVRHGSLVWRQAEFLNHAVDAVLALYNDVESVMVVGHSLGGMVTRAAFTLPSYRVGSITDIITLGTPHDRAPWGMDYSYQGLYQCTDALWRHHSALRPGSKFSPCWAGVKAFTTTRRDEAGEDTSHDEEACLVVGEDGSDADAAAACSSSSETAAIESDTATATATTIAGGSTARQGAAAGLGADVLLGNTVLLMVSGGLKDLVVHPSLTIADGLGLEGHSAGFSTTEMRGCGIGVDHQALVWCKQVIARVVRTLSELERLHALGAGAIERTVAATSLLESSNNGVPESSYDLFLKADPREATKGDELLMVARSLASDRFLLLIPAWAYVACLVLAAALTRGLFAKNAKEGALPAVPLLLTHEHHLQLGAARHVSRSLWTSVRAAGTPATAAFVASCTVAVLWVLSDAVAELIPAGASESFLGLLLSVPGGAVAVTFLRLLSGSATSVVTTLNPFAGARDALRLHPFSGIIGAYTAVLGWMVGFVYAMMMLGALGNRIRRLLPITTPVVRLLRSGNVAAAAACAVFFAAHVETFSLPPTFREISLRGELSVVFMMLSLSLYALLGSLALFPSRSQAAAAHQHLILLLYGPIGVLLNGPQMAATGIILAHRGGHSPWPHESFVGSAELALASVALLPIIVSVWLARRARSFPSPPSLHAFWAELRALAAEESTARAGGGSGCGSRAGIGCGATSDAAGAAALAVAVLENPNGHGACQNCLHADGGPGAIFVETDKERVPVGTGVSLGPGFRVVACDCPRREPAAPSGWCEFCCCVCKVCGGCKEAMRAVRAARVRAEGGRRNGSRGAGGDLSEELGVAAGVGIASVVVLYAGLWAFGMNMVAAPCHALIAQAVVGTVLCGMHWGQAKDAANGRARS